MEVRTNTKLKNTIKLIPYSSFDKWYVSYYINPFEIKSRYRIIKLKDLITPIKEKISLKNYTNDLRVVKKISFKDGKIHLREDNETNMDLYVVNRNDLLISKINFHQGAVALNPYEKIVCTTHYQPYSINRELVLDEYLIIYLRSNPFKNYISYIRADGIKNEATYDFIGNLPIPLPPMNIQKKLITAYKSKIDKAQKLHLKATNNEKKIDSYLLKILNINIEKTKRTKGMSFTKFSSIDRWDTDYLFTLNSMKVITEGKYPAQKVRNLLLSYQYGLSVKATEEPVGIPMLRMNNINNSELTINDLKYIKVENGQKEKFLLNKKDLLFNRTNSKELVGKTAVFNLSGEYTFASYLIRLKFDPQKVNVDYINYLFNSSIGRTQIDMISRQVLGQANVNSQELQDFIFPIPNLKTQDRISSVIANIKNNSKKLKYMGEIQKLEAISEIEKIIFKL